MLCCSQVLAIVHIEQNSSAWKKMNSHQGAVNIEHERSECLLSTAVRYCSKAPIRQLACVAVALN